MLLILCEIFCFDLLDVVMLLIYVFIFSFKQFNVKFDSIGLIVCALTDSNNR
jgi:hypothetical protein